MTLAETFRKYHALLEPRARRGFYALCAIAALAGFMETLAVASILPFLAALANPELAGVDPRLARLLALAGAPGQSGAVAWLGGIVLLILILANALSAASTWLLQRFANRQGHALSVRLLASYLAKPYAFCLDRHTAELQKNVYGEVQRVTSGILIPAAHIVAKLCVVLFVAALLLLVDPVTALVVATVLGLAYMALYGLARATLRVAGRDSVEAGTLRAKRGIEALTGFKEIKLLGRESEFVARFRQPSLRWADAQTKAQALGMLPRYAVETIAFSLILILAITLLGSGRGANEILPLLGLYAFAGYRLMPALQAVFSGLASVRAASPALEALLKDLQADAGGSDARPQTPRATRLGLSTRIALIDIRFRYPGAPAYALDGLNLDIPRNASIALVGPTGCGKTTVLDLLIGLLQPVSGRLEIDGVRVSGQNMRDWQRNIGHVPQQIFICDDSVARNIAFGMPDEDIDWAKLERASRLARLHDFVAGELPQGYRTLVGERGIRLSGGQRQRIGIARALYHDPEVLVFDEATSALDNATENALLESLQGLAGRKTLITVAHRMTTVRHCDRIHVMEKGRIVESGTYAELAARADRFRALNAHGG